MEKMDKMSTFKMLDNNSPKNQVYRCGDCRRLGIKICDHDPAQAYLGRPHHRVVLDGILAPKVVVVIGATERPGSVGRTCVQNLNDANTLNNFKVYGVNPTRKEVLGCKCFPSVLDIEETVDLALIVLPSKAVQNAVDECGRKGAGGVVVISAGFKELGAEGLEMENELVATARRYGVPLIGPNCLGVMRPKYGLNATFAATSALKGNIAFMSQSGAMCTAVLDWSIKEGVGFSAFVSIGSMADVNWGQLIDYLGHDDDTESILIYMETIGDAAAFLSAAKEVAYAKRIVVIKAGKSEAAAKAAESHTGSLAGTYDAFLAAMRRVGVLVVDTIGELFDCALTLGKQPNPPGPNLLIITNAGGPGVLATDAVSLSGATVANLSDECVEKLSQFLPAAWSHSNPVDILGDASPAIYAKTLATVMQYKDFDGVLVILSPQSVTDSTGTAQELLKAVKSVPHTIPIFASWMGGKVVQEGFDILTIGGIPTYPYPDAAAHTFGMLWKQSKDLQLMTETPTLEALPFHPPTSSVYWMVSKARTQGRELLTEAESKEFLKAFEIPIADTVICASEDEAVKAANAMKYPCVVKLNSETITHKSDVGGVKLNLTSESEIRKAFQEIKVNVDKIGPQHFQGVTVQPMLALDKGIELILGSIVDDQFGPLVLFGSGGCMVEIYKDTRLCLPPLNTTLAQRLMEDTRIFEALKGGQGQRFPGINLAELNKTLVRFSQMVCEAGSFVEEIDINPLLALPDRVIALDARVVLRKPDLPKPRLAIRPYPMEYVLKGQKLSTGEDVTLRPADFNDFSRFIDFHNKLSAVTIRQRYLSDVALTDRVAHQKVVSVCCADYARLLPILAVLDKTGEMIAIARLTRNSDDPSTAELKLAVADDFQHRGLGKLMMRHIKDIAATDGISELHAIVSEENGGMMKLLDKNHFHKTVYPENPKHIHFQRTFNTLEPKNSWMFL